VGGGDNQQNWQGSVMFLVKTAFGFWGFFFLFLKAREAPSKKREAPSNKKEGDSKTTNPVVTKSYKKPKITSSWFYQCHP
jgi:hypothetical protein